MEPGVIMATQNFKRNLFINLYREGKNLTLVCFPLPLKRETKNCLTLEAYFLHLETPGLPACYPLTPLQTEERFETQRKMWNSKSLGAWEQIILFSHCTQTRLPCQDREASEPFVTQNTATPDSFTSWLHGVGCGSLRPHWATIPSNCERFT